MNKKIFSIPIIIFVIAMCWPGLRCNPLDISRNDDIYNEDTSADQGYNGNLDKKTIDQLHNCDRDLDTMELCMRCAKITKSTIVYPLCCANEDKIKDWCHDYVFFGTL